ncbi:MAG: hypothetical protein IKY04_08080 [Lachnospiraceae bacterium]|nr:hypothetical protein [Lachnospiraceae bacterium]
MKKKILATLLSLTMVLSLVACSGNAANTTTEEKTEEPAVTAEESTEASVAETTEAKTETTEEAPKWEKGGKQVIVYYPNWYLGDKAGADGGEVGSIAWDSVTIVNHAFFEVYPADGTTDSTFDWRSAGNEPRTQFACVSTEPEADFEDDEISELNDSPRNHFTQYGIYAEKYPDVKIMISVGGWTDCGYFSEMCYTEEGRQSFTESCVDLMKEYPWIDGIDIDWEYPAGDPDGERWPEDEYDEGCPIWGTADEDNKNFEALLILMRDTFDSEFGEGEKMITSCASGSTGWTLPCQDWEAFAPHLDFINIMTYDLAGTWDGVTGHASSAALTKSGIAYFVNRGIPSTKLNIGSPMYTTWFKIKGDEMPSSVVNVEIDDTAHFNGDAATIEDTLEWEKEAVKGYSYDLVNDEYVFGEKYDNSEGDTVKGWNFGYDKIAGATYLYNNDPDSDYYMWYVSYENLLTLQLKLEMINRYKCAGIIVWESTEDTTDHVMVGRMGEYLNGK